MTEAKKGLSRREAFLAAAGTLAAPALIGALSRTAEAASPMLGVARPTHYRFKLGNFEITTIWDGAVQLDGPHPIFGENQKPEDVAKLAEQNLLPGKRMEISFTPVIVNTGKEVVMFDAGNGAGRRPNAGRVAATLATAGYTPEQIDVVIITHFHGDHIGGLMENGKPLFPNARYVTGETEYNFWSPTAMTEGNLAAAAKLVQSNVVPLAPKTTFVKPGQAAVSGITALGAFGHTPGHMAYHLESEGRRFVIWADTTNHNVVSMQRPDWHVRFDMDKEKAVQARKSLLGMVAADKIPASGYHMPFPAVGYVETSGAGFRWVQASYQLML